MARFGKSAAALLVVDAVLAALFLWGPGLPVPPATSVGPPSACIAQAPVYEAIALLQALIAGFLTTSVSLCMLVGVEVAWNGDDTVTGMHPFLMRLQRGSMVVAIGLSAAVVGLGLRVYGYVLEAKISVYSCLPISTRVTFIGNCILTAVVCTCVFGRLIWIVTFYQ